MSEGWLARPLDEIAAALRAGKTRAATLLDEARARHAEFGSALHAYRVWDDAGAAACAELADAAFRDGKDNGPLQGIPVSVKDLFGIAGFDTCGGCPSPLPQEWEREGPVVAALRAQCPVITGKTHMVQFAFGALGTNVHWPVPRNPWDAAVHRVSGGSSSGAGVSLHEGSAIVAFGSDTAGSVRVPASLTGTVGLKPSAGRWSIEGMVPLSHTFDTPGVLTRSVADAATVFDALDPALTGEAGAAIPRDTALSAITVAVGGAFFWEDCSPGITEAVEQAIAELRSGSIRIASASLPGLQEVYALMRDGGLTAPEFQHFVETRLPDRIETLDPMVSGRMGKGPKFDTPAYYERRERLRVLAAAANEAIASVDVVVSPTAALTAPAVSAVAELSDYMAAQGRLIRNTCVANLLGLCALTLPVGLDREGMPVGLQCMARAGNEARLLEVGLAMERRLGTAMQRLGPAPMARSR